MSDAHAALRDFVAGHAAAYARADVEAIADGMGLPQMIAHGTGTTFVEDDGQLDIWVEERLARWAAHGVSGVTAAVEAVEDLPDDAARATSRWTLTGGDGVTVATFAAVDTLARDDDEWYFVVTDTAGEDAAWNGVN